MSGAILVILGGVIGAAAAGGVQVWIDWKQRLLARRVAARAILGDLYLTEGLFKGISEYRRWPEVLDISRPLDTWKEFRGPFAASVTATEWVQVDNVYGVIHQISLASNLGQISVESVIPTVDGLLKRLRTHKGSWPNMPQIPCKSRGRSWKPWRSHPRFRGSRVDPASFALPLTGPV